MAGSCAAVRGLQVRDGVRLYRQCGTVQVCGYCIAKGYLETFRVVRVEMLQPAVDADGLNVSDWTLHQNRQGLPEERTASTGLE
jgi:hypothetical protein